MKSRKISLPIYFSLGLFAITLIWAGVLFRQNRKHSIDLTEKENTGLNIIIATQNIQRLLFTINSTDIRIISAEKFTNEGGAEYKKNIDSINTYLKTLQKSSLITKHFTDDVVKVASIINERIQLSENIIQLSAAKKQQEAFHLFHKDSSIQLRSNLTLLLQNINANAVTLLHHYQDDRQTYAHTFWKLFLILCFIVTPLFLFAGYTLIIHINQTIFLNKKFKLLSDVVANVADATLITDKNHNIIYWNKAAAKLYGKQEHEVIGKHVAVAVGSKNTEEEGNLMFEEVDRRGFWTGEVKNTHANNTPLTILTTISVLKNENQEPIGYYSVNIDFATLKNEIELKSYQSTLLNTIQDCIYAFNSNLEVTLWNKAAETFFGYKYADVKQKNIRELLSRHWVVPEEAIAARHKIEDKGEWSGEIRVYDKDGNIRHLMFTVDAVVNTESVITDYIVFTKDITKIKELEEQLKQYSQQLEEVVDQQGELNKRLSAIIENSAAMVGIMDVHHKIIYLNEAAKEKLLVPLNEDVRNLDAAIFFSPDGKFDAEIISEVMLHGKWQGKNLLYNRNGLPIPIMQVIYLHKDAQGQPEFISSTSIDISELEQKEQEVKRLSSIVENTNAIVVITDINWRLTYANAAARNKLGIGRDEDITKLYTYEFLCENSLKEIAKEEQRLIEEGRWFGEIEYKSRSGKIIPALQMVLIHKNAENQPEYISITSIDISSQKSVEKELKKTSAELLDLYNRIQNVREEERNEVARDIHDELGQNLTLIKMATFSLKKNCGDQYPHLSESVNTIFQLTQDTIDLGRKIVSNLRPNMLDDIGLPATLQWHAKTFIKSSGIDLSLNIQPYNINFNKSVNLCVYRVFQESLTNVIRYSKASLVTINVLLNGDIVDLLISDNGCGFDISEIDTTKHHGLVGMRERVYALNGSIEINSSPGKGTIIKVSIPDVNPHPLP
ncbi:MAG: PAS domain S-box protein [Bacteroidota bacterium]|nr:PAS domain S-box protein [Bacteroidota bacterium]